MSRHPLLVRDASPADVTELLDLWAGAGSSTEQIAGLAQEAPVLEADAVAAVTAIAAAPGERLLVSEQAGSVVAALHVRLAPISPLRTEVAVHATYLLVLPEHRRHGHAHVLLDAALLWAEELGIANLLVTTSSASRESNRYLARLGLATVATGRIAPVTTVRKRLGPERRVPAVSRAQSRAQSRNLGQVLAQRRSMRRREVARD